ncbi:MAG: hypothetical protein Q9169_000872 [Polycauliona sp. 2 TL-2023]
MHPPERDIPSLQPISVIPPTAQNNLHTMSPTPEAKQSKTLTPPCTPPPYHVKKAAADTEEHGRHALSNISNTADINVQYNPRASVILTAGEILTWEMILPLPYAKNYHLSPSSSSGYKEFGRGAWSTVYEATETPETSPSTPPTPASSPVNSASKPAACQALAIKAPARNDGHDILYHEARILTYLHSCLRATDYVVPFHGYNVSSKSLVMNAIPLNLETHSRACLTKTRAEFSTRTMFDPVYGSQDWQILATQLIDGLEFLHSSGCIHGDIKPSNILLQPNNEGSSKTYTPLYCDFSSSRIVDGSRVSNTEPAQHITAMTPDYASPELLTSLRSTGAVATTAADVYALAVTLVVAAIGESPFTGASMEMMKLSMAREGKVLAFARQADQGTRIMKGKMVERWLRGALDVDAKQRSTAMEWKSNVHTLLKGSGAPPSS